jgi:hypothetical protein
MRPSIILLSTACVRAITTSTHADLNIDAAMPRDGDDARAYFDMLAIKLDASRAMALLDMCDTSRIIIPPSEFLKSQYASDSH